MVTNIYKDGKKEPDVAVYTRIWIELINHIEKSDRFPS